MSERQGLRVKHAATNSVLCRPARSHQARTRTAPSTSLTTRPLCRCPVTKPRQGPKSKLLRQTARCPASRHAGPVCSFSGQTPPPPRNLLLSPSRGARCQYHRQHFLGMRTSSDCRGGKLSGAWYVGVYVGRHRIRRKGRQALVREARWRFDAFDGSTDFDGDVDGRWPMVDGRWSMVGGR